MQQSWVKYPISINYQVHKISMATPLNAFNFPNCRLGYGGELLKEVRLPLMPASDIVDHVENTSYLMEVTECRQLVKEALHYHCLPSRQSVLQVRFMSLIKVSKQEQSLDTRAKGPRFTFQPSQK